MTVTVQRATKARVAKAASMRSSRQVRVMASSVETAAQRYARAAAKYRTGPRSSTMYTPPKLLLNTDMEDLNLKDQVAQFSSSAASNPQLYALKLSQERKQQMEELHHNEPMRWEDIV